MIRGHGEDANVLLYDADMAVLIYQLHKSVSQWGGILTFWNFDHHTRKEVEIELRDDFTVYADTASWEYGFGFWTANAIKRLEDEGQELGLFLHLKCGVLGSLRIVH